MKRFPFVAAMLATVPALASPLTNTAVAPPAAVPFHETVFGTRIDDPYRWMETQAGAKAMTAWVTALSDATIAELAALPERRRFVAVLEEASQAGLRYGMVRSTGAALFYLKQTPADRVADLMVRPAGDQDAAHERLLLDPLAGSKGLAAISNYTVSPDGRSVAVHVAKGGGEVGDVRFLDVATGKPEGLPLGPIWGEFEVSWITPDRIAYTGMAAPRPGTDPMLNMRSAVVAPGAAGPGNFILGAGVQQAPVFTPVEFPSAHMFPTSDLVLGEASGALGDYRVFVARADAVAAGHPSWRELAGYDDQVQGYAALGNAVYFFTTKRQSNGEIVKRAVETGGVSGPQIVLQSGDLVITDLCAARDGLYVSAQREGIGHLLFLPGGTGPAREVRLPIEGDLEDLRSADQGRSVTFGLMGWTTSMAFYRATAGMAAPVGLASASWAGARGISVMHDEAVSADGTRVPMVTLLPPGGITHDLPTVLEGYGGYGVSMTSPWYSPFLLAWVAHGGAISMCGTRGGGERGRNWHEAGRERNKPNGHADYIACSERLIANGTTSPARLVATGTSAGGEMAPPAALKRPDLFAALLPRVAILNPTRLAAAENGANQFAEMGDPGTPAGFAALASADSVRLLQTAKDMPDTLATVGLNDGRVAPWMGAKFIAAARARFGGRRLALIRADAQAGHGVGSARDREVAEFADIYSFAWDRTHRAASPIAKTR